MSAGKGCFKRNEQVVRSKSARKHLGMISDAADAAEAMVQGFGHTCFAMHTSRMLPGVPELGRLPDALAGAPSLASSSQALCRPGSRVSSLPGPPEPQGTGSWRPGPAEPDAAALQHRLACCRGRCLSLLAGCPALAGLHLALWLAMQGWEGLQLVAHRARMTSACWLSL